MCKSFKYVLWIIQSKAYNVFGGFRTQKWTTSEKGVSDQHAFLFSLRSAKNHPAQSFGLKSGKTDADSAVSFESRAFVHFGTFDTAADKSGEVASGCGRYKIYDVSSGTGHLNGGQETFKLHDLETFCCE